MPSARRTRTLRVWSRLGLGIRVPSVVALTRTVTSHVNLLSTISFRLNTKGCRRRPGCHASSESIVGPLWYRDFAGHLHAHVVECSQDPGFASVAFVEQFILPEAQNSPVCAAGIRVELRVSFNVARDGWVSMRAGVLASRRVETGRRTVPPGHRDLPGRPRRGHHDRGTRLGHRRSPRGWPGHSVPRPPWTAPASRSGSSNPVRGRPRRTRRPHHQLRGQDRLKTQTATGRHDQTQPRHDRPLSAWM
jgi:hypothetical protein